MKLRKFSRIFVGIIFLSLLLFQTVSFGAYAQSNDEIPAWIKNNAGWWSDGQITDDDFLKGIEFLVKNGIIKVD